MTDKKIALVTGAAQGIGLSIASSLAAQGNAVALADIDAEKAASAAAGLRDSGAAAMGVAMDVTSPESIARGLDAVRGELGAPTMLINNAGVYRGGPTLELEIDTWRQLIDMMLTGPMLLAQSLLPHMVEAGFGRIVNMGSLVSHTAFGQDLAYCVAKTGVIGFTRSLAAEFAKHQVCVNAVCPGNVLTDLMREAGRKFAQRDGLDKETWIEERGKDIPLGRLGEPEDVARLVAFLCSDDAAYITGQTVTINGGLYYL